jgi:folate-binding protein YgfZ
MDLWKSARIRLNRPRKCKGLGLGKFRKYMLMQNDWRVITELGLGTLRVRGADAITFLQGQLSNDVARVQTGQLQLSGYHTPQGRAIALLRLTALAPDDLLAVLPRELVADVATRLKRYVLRAKVQISDESAQWEILGSQAPAPALPDGALSLAYGSSRQLILIPQSSDAPDAVATVIAAAGVRGAARDWVARDIAEGLPQVYLPTSEAFVAQMLNLDLIGGIALDKGCYTGQEIIARAHYRGQVKRRMQRFVSEIPCALSPGQIGVLTDGRSFKVVAAVAVEGGRCEFLAVTNPEPSAEAEVAASATHVLITARPLALPYALPATPA